MRSRFATIEEKMAVSLLAIAVLFLFAAVGIGGGVGEGLVVGAVFFFLIALVLALWGYFLSDDGKSRAPRAVQALDDLWKEEGA